MKYRKVVVQMMVLICLIFSTFINGKTIKAIDTNDIKVIGTNVSVEDTLENTNDTNYYKFTIDKTGYFQIGFQIPEVGVATKYGWEISIIDTNGNSTIYTTTSTGDITLPKMPFEKGKEIYVKVSPGNNALSSWVPINVKYQITVNTYEDTSWEGEYNNSTETADEILANQVYKGNLHSSSEVDYYHFVMDRTGYFDISFTIPEVDAYISNGWEITIFQEQAEINSFIATSNATTRPYAFKKGTNVYIRIQAKKTYFSPTFTEYNMKITAQDNEQWEREGNGSIEAANSMKIGTIYYGTAYTNYDTDYYCVTTNKNGFFTMTFNPNDIAENLGDGYKLNLYDAENKELYSTSKVIEKSDWKFYLKKGTYYIRISVDDTYDAPSAYSIYTIDTSLKMAEKPGKTKIKSDSVK